MKMSEKSRNSPLLKARKRINYTLFQKFRAALWKLHVFSTNQEGKHIQVYPSTPCRLLATCAAVKAARASRDTV